MHRAIRRCSDTLTILTLGARAAWLLERIIAAPRLVLVKLPPPSAQALLGCAPAHVSGQRLSDLQARWRHDFLQRSWRPCDECRESGTRREALCPAMESELTRRLALIVDWYKGMVSPEEGRLVYTYYPEEDFAVADGSPIRDIASVWDIEVLCRFLDRTDLLPIAERSLRHFTGWLVARNGGLILDSERLGEPSGIAHSAFLLLSLLESHLPDRQSTMFALADGILGQQRHDGSYKVHFGDEPDDGIEFYPGEAMLALMEAYTSTGTSQYLASVERGFAYCRDRFGSASASSGLLVFLANWQSQYAAVLHERTHDDTLREQVRDYVMLLHDRILHGGFYEEIERVPVQQATVEVACALEGINDAYTIAVRERDARHVQAYERAIRIAVAYLFRAQRLDDCTPRERGGFGHSLGDRTQRVDVTGHVVGGFIKTVRNHVTTERSAAPAGIGTMRGPL